MARENENAGEIRQSHVMNAEVSDRAVMSDSLSARAYERLSPDHDCYRLIGRVAEEWAQLEHALDEIIWELSGVSPYFGSCITGQMIGVTPRFRAVIALATAKGLAVHKIEEVRVLMNDTYNPQDQRNRIVHDPWYLDKETGQPAQFRSMPSKKLLYGIVDIDIKEINATIDRIGRRTQRVRTLRNELFLP